MPATFTELEIQHVDKAPFDQSLASMSRLAHELIDQLSIIGLCCFKIRETLKETDLKPSRDCQTIADAVQEVTKLIDALTEIASAVKRPAVNRKRFDSTTDCEQ